MEIGQYFKEHGVIYLLHQMWSEEEKQVVVGVPNNGRMKIWLNGEFLHTTKEVSPLRADQGNGGALGDLSNYKTTTLMRGWNQFLIKMENINIPWEGHFVVGGLHPWCVKNHGESLLGVKQSRFIWEKE